MNRNSPLTITLHLARPHILGHESKGAISFRTWQNKTEMGKNVQYTKIDTFCTGKRSCDGVIFHLSCILKFYWRITGTKYSRVAKAKFVEDNLQKNWRAMVWFSRPYPIKFLKGCLPQILLVHSWIFCPDSFAMFFASCFKNAFL